MFHREFRQRMHKAVNHTVRTLYAARLVKHEPNPSKQYHFVRDDMLRGKWRMEIYREELDQLREKRDAVQNGPLILRIWHWQLLHFPFEKCYQLLKDGGSNVAEAERELEAYRKRA